MTEGMPLHAFDVLTRDSPLSRLVGVCIHHGRMGAQRDFQRVKANVEEVEVCLWVRLPEDHTPQLPAHDDHVHQKSKRHARADTRDGKGKAEKASAHDIWRINAQVWRDSAGGSLTMLSRMSRS